MRVDANVNVTCIDAVMLGVRHGDEERENSQHQHNQSEYKKSFHTHAMMAICTQKCKPYEVEVALWYD